MSGTVSERFWSKVEKIPFHSCWEWNRAKNKFGYGIFYLNKKMQLAHRVSWQINFGDIGNGLLICHTCDNPACVNPNHLFLGTTKDNILDKIKKGRGKSFSDFNRMKTSCVRGHEFTKENTLKVHQNGGTARVCRKCLNIRSKEFRAKAKRQKNDL